MIPVCIFAKPPVPGRVKTRLAAAVGPDVAAGLARAFLSDVLATVSSRPWARAVVSSTTDDPAALGVDGVPVWHQGPGDLGARMARTLSRALTDAPAAIALGADLPDLPPTRLDAARDALRDHDAVLGPTPDGGFYLLGLRRSTPDLLDDLPWSAPDTRAATRARLLARGLSVALLDPWPDVDTPDDLARLRDRLRSAPHTAPATARRLLGGRAG